MEDKKKPINTQIYIGIGLTALTAIIIAILWYSVNIFFLIFSGILLAIFLRTLSNILSEKINITDIFSVSIIILSIIGFFILFGIFLIPTVSDQIDQLVQELPNAWEKISQNVQDYLQWKPISSLTNNANFTDLIPKNKDILLKATDLFSITFGAIGSFIIFLFIGIFIAYDPQTYRDGFINLSR